LTTHFLDANIFLELKIDDGDYGEFCDELFKKKCDKTTNNRILKEIKDIKELLEKCFDRLVIFYRKNNKMDHFISERKISEKDMERLRTIDDWINQTHGGKAKIQRLEFLKSYFIKTVESRTTCINIDIIPSSNNSTLYGKIYSVMSDPDDAWHITDAYTWCTSNGAILVWSIDKHVIGSREEILTVICDHGKITRSLCNLDIKHIKDIDTYRF
jgi:hypothetical protein